MVRSVFFAVVLGLLAVPAIGQRNLEVGVSGGVTQFYGDLGNLNGAVQWNSTRPGMAMPVEA